ncbi:MAG: DUF615 domain-containing protein [Hydrogenophilus sp.]|nr:DUF615 domain-containing protein [Hydrogenophilus sp.]
MMERSGWSKTKAKRAMEALQAVGEQLVSLPAERVAWLALPERLHQAIAEARRIASFEGRRRQLQYIGRLLEAYEPEGMAELVAALAPGGAVERHCWAEAEALARRFLADEAFVGVLRERFPTADLVHWRRLRRAVVMAEGGEGRALPEWQQLVSELGRLLLAGVRLELPRRVKAIEEEEFPQSDRE